MRKKMKLVNHLIVSLFITFYVTSHALADMRNLSNKYASVEDKSVTDSPYTVYFIQDAHCNPQAQMSIYNVIKYLIEYEGAEIIAMEGAEGQIVADDLRCFPSEETKKLVSDYFLKNGRINGVEYYAINDSNPLKVMGMEDRSIYQENFSYLLQGFQLGEQTDILAQLTESLDSIKSNVYSGELQDMELMEQQYQSNQISLQDYFLNLIQTSKDNACFSSTSYPQLDICAQMIALERQLKLGNIEKERAKLVRVLTERMSKDQITGFLQENMKFRLDKISYLNYLSYLFGLSDDFGVDISQYKELVLYRDYLKLHESISHTVLFSEAEQLSEELFESLCQNESQRRLHDIGKEIKGLRKAFELKLSSKDWASMKNGKMFFYDEASLAFFKSCGCETLGDDVVNALKTGFDVVKNFYDCAEKRDSIMVEKTLSILNAQKAKKAIVVAGGYHCAGIVSKLKESDVSYYVLKTTVSEVSGNDSYQSLASGKLSRIEQYFADNFNSLALASWLENNPLSGSNNKFIFGNMFKSMMLSSLAWQMTGFDVASVTELNLPILQAIKNHLNSIAEQIGYDMQVNELTRIDDQVYIRLKIQDQELVYGLFAQRDILDWTDLSLANLNDSNVLDQFQFLGGSVLVLTTEQYSKILATARKDERTTPQQVSDGVIRSLLMHSKSEKIIDVLLVRLLDGKQESDINDVAGEIAFSLKTMNMNENQEAVSYYIRNAVAGLKNSGRLIVGENNKISFNWQTRLAASLLERVLNTDQGMLVQIESEDDEIKIKDGSIRYVFLSDEIPLRVIEAFFDSLNDQTGKGNYEISRSGETVYQAKIMSFDKEILFALISSQERLPEVQRLSDTYSRTLAQDGISITPADNIAFVMNNVTDTQKTVSFAKLTDTGEVSDLVGPSMSIDIENFEKLDKAIAGLHEFAQAENIPVSQAMGEFQAKYTAISNLFRSAFPLSTVGISPETQRKEFKIMLEAFLFAADHNMDNTLGILTKNIVDIIQGKSPRYHLIESALNSQTSVAAIDLEKADMDLIYTIYLKYFDYNPDQIDADTLNPIILARILQEVYVDGETITPESAKEKVLESLKGGKYNIKLDSSTIEFQNERALLNEIFSDTNAMDTAFKNAGLSFENTKSIKVKISRLSKLSLVSDFTMTVEDYRGNEHVLRLRAVDNPTYYSLFANHLQSMQIKSPEHAKLFPNLYYYSGPTEVGIRWSVVQHVEGILADRINMYPDEFSAQEELLTKIEAAKAWLKFWQLEKKDISLGETTQVLHKSNIMLPTSLSGVVIPEDGSDAMILGIGFSMPNPPVSFFEFLTAVGSGFDLKKKEHLIVLGNAMISVLGFDDSIQFLNEALAELKVVYLGAEFEQDDIDFASVNALKLYVNSVRHYMERDSLKELINVVYGGNTIEAFNHIYRTAVKKKIDPLQLLQGKITLWSKKKPSVAEARAELKQKNPSILTVTGGTGGNSLINAIKNIEDASVVNLVTTFDSGGQSYRWQDILDPMVGYVYSMGDKTNVAVAYLDEAKQDLMNKRLPENIQTDSISPLIPDLIGPTLAKYPELKNTPEFLIDFIDVVHQIDKLIEFINLKHEENPDKYKRIDLRKASLKNLFAEAINFFADSYDFDSGNLVLENTILGSYMMHGLLGMDKGLVIPISTDEGTLVARLKDPVSTDKISEYDDEMRIDTTIDRNRIQDDGMAVFGEHYIGEIGEMDDKFSKRIDYVETVTSPDQQQTKPAISEMADAAINYPSLDVILVGPGSLYTSILANFTVKGFVEALIKRKNEQIITYPGGQRIRVEPSARVFVVNPVYSPEDSDLSIKELLLMIEKTAQMATGNPDLKFEDMFDAVVMNDPTKSSDDVQSFVRKKDFKVIIPTDEDKAFMEDRGVESYSFDMCTIEKMPTRKPGFELEYVDKLTYSTEKLTLITNIFRKNIKAQKQARQINMGLGNGLDKEIKQEQVKKVLKKGEVRTLGTGKRFVSEGLKGLNAAAEQLAKRIERETDAELRTQMKQDLAFLHRIINLIKSRSLKIFSVQPESGSNGIIIEDPSQYQFAVTITTDEKGLRNGIYYSSGLVNAIERYFKQAEQMQLIGQHERSSLFNVRGVAAASEALFNQFAQWLVYMEDTESLTSEKVRSQIKRIGTNYISGKRPIYGSYLNEEMAQMVRQELAISNIGTVREVMSLKPDAPIADKITVLEEKVKNAKRALQYRDYLERGTLNLTEQWNDFMNLFFSLDQAEEIVENAKINSTISQLGYSSLGDLLIGYAVELENISESFVQEISADTVVLWTVKLGHIESVLTPLMEEFDKYGPVVAEDQRELYRDIRKKLFSTKIHVQALYSHASALMDNALMLDSLNLLNSVSIEQMEETLRNLNLDAVYELQPGLRMSDDVSPDIEAVNKMLSGLRDKELEVWMNQQIAKSTEGDVLKLNKNLDELLKILNMVMDFFPNLRGVDVNSIPANATEPEIFVIHALSEVKKMVEYQKLNDYSSIYYFGQALKHHYTAHMLAILRGMVPVKEKAVHYLINRASNVFDDLQGDYQRVQEEIYDIQKNYIQNFGRFVRYLASQDKLPGRNMFFGNESIGVSAVEVNKIIREGEVTRLTDDDMAFEGIKNNIQQAAFNLMIDSRTETTGDKQDMQSAAALLFRICDLLDSDNFRFWQVAPKDGNPGLFIDDENHFQFAAVTGNEIYFSQGFIDRINFLKSRGLTQTAMALISEAIVHQVGLRIFFEDLDTTLDAGRVEDLLWQYGMYISGRAPLLRIDGTMESVLHREITDIAKVYSQTGETDTAKMPIFNYPGDDPEFRYELREALLSDKMTIDEFLEYIVEHYVRMSELGAPSELLYNSEYYHPGEVLGYVKNFPQIHGTNVLGTHGPAGQKIIAESRTDEVVKQKASEVIEALLTSQEYKTFIDSLAPHELEDMMYDILRIVTNDDDPYNALKNEYNQKGLDSLADMDAMIHDQPDPLYAASLVAIAGNALDFADMKAHAELSESGFSFVDEIAKILGPDQHIVRNDYKALLDRLNEKPNQKIIYAIDNAGEIITDLPLIKLLIQMGHQVILTTRDKHTVNDVSYADALDLFANPQVVGYFVGEDGQSILTNENFRIIHSGSNVTGTDLRRATPEFIQEWQNADIRLLKGQGNYETLRYYPMRQDMYFLVKVKEPQATARQYKKGDVLIEHRIPNSIVGSYMTDGISAVGDKLHFGLNLKELDDFKEFIKFYLDYLSTRVNDLSILGDNTQITENFVEAREFLNRLKDHPQLKDSLMANIEIVMGRTDTLDILLSEFVEPAVNGVESSAQIMNEQFIVIDFQAVPDGDLGYLDQLLNSLAETRLDESAVNVKWAIFSDRLNTIDIMEELMRRKFYQPGMQIIGKDRLEFFKNKLEFKSAIDGVYQMVNSEFASSQLVPTAVKVITDNNHSAQFFANKNSIVIQIDSQDKFTKLSDFISGIVSIDSIIHGGKVPNLTVNTIDGSTAYTLADLLADGQTAVSADELTGKILGIKPSKPRKEKLRDFRLDRVVETAL